MISFQTIYAGAAVSCGLLANSWAREGVRTLDPLVVTGRSITEPWSLNETIVGSSYLREADAAEVVRRLPGVAIARNGSQTGILQLRGLSGDRVNVRVEGMEITPACPNHMDPPLHYASLSDGDLLSLYAGIAPVSEGGDSIGGSLHISRPDPVFADADAKLLDGELGASFRGSQDSGALDAKLGYAEGDWRIDYRGHVSTADDLRIPGGSVKDSGYETTHHGLVGSWRTAGGFVALDAGYVLTRDAGVPALPMDMIRDEGWNFGLHQKEALEWGTVESRLYLHDIEHLMDNHTLRPVMPGRMRMESPSTSRDYGLSSDVLVPRGESKYRVGIDLHRNEFDAVQVAVDSGMERDTYNEYRRNRAGLYFDWENQWDEKWSTRIGVRGDVVSTSAKAVSNQILPPAGPMRDMLLMDQMKFNSADRSFSDPMLDASASLSFEPDETTTVELAVAMKNRAPSMVERYQWTPLNASAGLADGRTYLGNLELDPETSFQIGLGLEKRGSCWNAELTPFYQIVDGYIQGEPIARMDMNGNQVLQFQNLDRADLYGAELAGGWDFHKDFGIDASMSYVRGRNKDTGGDLYRIAPLRGIVDLNYQDRCWESHLEWVWSAKQDQVSALQGETPSPGFGFLNFRVARVFAESVRWEIGVENIFDKRYADHLSGVNRVMGSDVAAGERVPGAGRFGYTSLSWSF